MDTQYTDIHLLDIFKKSDKSLSIFLEDSDIKNILLSGRFGIGKTTFIDEYFKQKKSKFELIKICPVNYSILTNQDIFKYIKFDILYTLLEKVNFDLDFEDANIISWIQGLPIYLQSNIITLLGSLGFLIPQIGKSAEKIFQLFIKHKDEFNKILSDANNDENTTFIKQFFTHINNEEGGLYENNQVTQIINKLLSLYESKKRVLVIDDLDRVDPQHIFRILNVLSAQSSKNKFHFDKIILVCDVENIRSIFSSNYGQKVDFNGYIDKFYDKEIFYFDNRESIASNIENILNSIQIGSTEPDFNTFLEKHSSGILKKLTTILTDSVMLDKINLRTLLKYRNKSLLLTKNKIHLEDSYYHFIENYRIQLILVFDILYKLLGKDLEHLLENLASKKSTFPYKQQTIGEALLVIEMEKFTPNNEELIYHDLKSETAIHYSIVEEFKTRTIYINNIYFYTMTGEKTIKETNLPLAYDLIHKAFLKLKDLSYY